MSESALWRSPDEARLVLVTDAPFGDGGHELISSDGHSTTATGQIPRPGPSRVPRRIPDGGASSSSPGDSRPRQGLGRVAPFVSVMGW